MNAMKAKKKLSAEKVFTAEGAILFQRFSPEDEDWVRMRTEDLFFDVSLILNLVLRHILFKEKNYSLGLWLVPTRAASAFVLPSRFKSQNR